MNNLNIINTIQNRYIYYDKIGSELKSNLEKLKKKSDSNNFNMDLSHILKNFNDPHSYFYFMNKSKYILPIYFAIMSENLVVIESDNKYSNIKKGFVLFAINGKKIKDRLFELSEYATETLKFMRILDEVSTCSEAIEISLTFATNDSEYITEIVAYGNIDFNGINHSLQDQINSYERFYDKYNLSCCKCPSLMSLEQMNIFENSLNNIDAKNVLIDIRNNIGGRIDLAIKLSELFVTNEKTIYLKSRTSIETIKIIPRKSELRNKKVGILFNNLTCSSLEFIFLNSIMDEKVFFIGSPTCGMKDVATIFKTNENELLSLTTKIYVDSYGNVCDQKNIIPHKYIDANIEDIIEGKDRQLSKAINFLVGCE